MIFSRSSELAVFAINKQPAGVHVIKFRMPKYLGISSERGHSLQQKGPLKRHDAPGRSNDGRRVINALRQFLLCWIVVVTVMLNMSGEAHAQSARGYFAFVKDLKTEFDNVFRSAIKGIMVAYGSG
jgi:hypothetical protein